MTVQRMRGSGRVVLPFACQAVGSLRTFLVVVTAANLLDPESFGAFSLGFVAYTLFQSGIAAWACEPLVLLAADDVAGQRSALRRVVVASTVLAMLLAAGAAAARNTEVGLVLVGLAACLPVLGAYEVSRTVALARDRGGVALASDVVWLAWTVVLLGVGAPGSSPELLVLGWGSGAALGVLVLGVLVLGVPVLGGPVLDVPVMGLRPARAGQARVLASRTTARLDNRFLLEFVLVRATGQVSLLLLGAVAGATATGAIRGVSSLFGPIGVVISTLPALVVPSFRALSAMRRRTLVILLGLLLGLGPLLAGMLLLVVPRLGESLLGATWTLGTPLVWPIALQFAAMGLGGIAFVQLRVQSPRSTLRVRVRAAVAYVGLFWTGYLLAGVPGAAWGMCAGAATQSVLAWLTLRRLPAVEGDERAASDGARGAARAHG